MKIIINKINIIFNQININMPNWCECQLIIKSNNKEELNKFYEDNKGENNIPLSFNKSLPLPENQANNWYGWRVQNWGTKWDLDEETIFSNNNYLDYIFSTAWSPPLDWLNYVSVIYPKLNFYIEYGEGGMNFAGQVEIINGEIINSDEYSFSFYIWKNNKLDILHSMIYFVLQKEDVKERINYITNLKINIINKITNLPDELNKLILNYINIKKKIIYDYIESNIEEVNEFLEDNMGIYDVSIISEHLLPSIKKINNF